MSVFVFVIPFPLAAAESAPLAAWSFGRDLAGWRPNGEVKGLRHEDGAARFRAEGLDPIIDGPAFGPIRATNGQTVEVVLRRASGGNAQLFFTNTGEGPFGGFREEWSVRFDLPATGERATVTVRPFWEALGTVSRLRFDPPPGEMALEAIRIIPAPDPGRAAGLPPGGIDLGRPEPLRGIARLEIAPSPGGILGVRAEASGWGAAFLIPAGGIEASGRSIWEIEYGPGSPAVVSVLWASAGRVGLQEAGRSKTVVDPGDREVLDLSGHPGWKGKVTHIGIRFGRAAGDRIEVTGVRIREAPRPEPHLVLRFLGTMAAVRRAGGPIEIEAWLENIGGKAHPGGAARLAAAGTDAAPALEIGRPETLLPPVEPGATARISFHAIAPRPGPIPLVLDVGGRPYRGEIAIDPPRPFRARNGLPPPAPVATDRRIGIYYFPGWSPEQWTRWKSQLPFPERTPELGFYREGDPEVMDWHIRWAVENGISFFVFDWYWRDGRVVLERGLHDGFLTAKNRNLMKFAVMWANHDPFTGHTKEQLLAVTDFWIENYFRRPEYLLVDGRPAVLFFAPDNLTRDLKGSDAVRDAFEAMRARARAAGLPGLWIAACGQSHLGAREAFARQGYDAVTAYNYPTAGSRGDLRSPFATFVEGHDEVWRSSIEPADPARPAVPYVPLLAVGWDSRPWHGSSAVARTGRTAGGFEAGLRALEGHLERTGGTMAILEAWNEFGEGSDIEPTSETGFGLLEAVRRVFGKGPFPENIVPADVGIVLPSIDPVRLAARDRAKEDGTVKVLGRNLLVTEGLDARIEGDLLTVLPGKIGSGAGAREVREAVTLRVRPSPIVRVVQIKLHPLPADPAQPDPLLEEKGPGDPGAAGSIVPGSLRVRKDWGPAPGGMRPHLLRGRDWEADEDRGTLWALPGGQGAAGSSEISFQRGLERIDTVWIGPKGEVTLSEGEPAPAGEARPPAAREGCLKLLDLRMRPRGALLDPEDILPEGIEP